MSKTYLPKWCKPKDYKIGLRVEECWSKDHNKGTILEYAGKNEDNEDCWIINWDDEDFDLNNGENRFWIGFLKIIKSKTLKEFLENGN